MVTAVWASGILAGFLSLHSSGRRRKACNLFVLAAAVLFLSCNNTSPDEINLQYSYDYHTIGINLSSVLYQLAVMLAGQLQVSFSLFNFITAAAAMLLIVNALSQYTRSWGFSLSLYLLAGAILDVSLYRQFLASAFVVYGFRYLLTEHKKPGRYMLCILAASLVHSAMAVYLVFAVVGQKGSIRHRLYVCVYGGIFTASAVLSIATLINGRVVPGVAAVAQFISGRDNNKLEGYIQSAGGRFGWLLVLLLWLVSMFAVHVLSSCKDIAASSAISGYMQDLKEIFGLSVCFLPFGIMMAAVFSRLYRPLVWPVIILVTVLAEHMPAKTLDCRLASATAVYLGYYFMCYNCILFDWEFCTEMIFQGTLFWIQGA